MLRNNRHVIRSIETIIAIVLAKHYRWLKGTILDKINELGQHIASSMNVFGQDAIVQMSIVIDPSVIAQSVALSFQNDVI